MNEFYTSLYVTNMLGPYFHHSRKIKITEFLDFWLLTQTSIVLSFEEIALKFVSAGELVSCVDFRLWNSNQCIKA